MMCTKNWRWLISRKFRQAADVRKQAWFILNSQRDQLQPHALDEVEGGLTAFDQAFRAAGKPAEAVAAADRLEEVAAKWLKPYANASARENIKEFLVSGVFILSVFTFFIQPMKIPSGSAQPTLYGNVVYDLKETGEAVPGLAGRFVDWFKGFGYHEWVAAEDGTLEILGEQRSLGFIRSQTFRIGKDTHTFWWPPDHLERGCGVHSGQQFHKGDTVFRLKLRSGDRLFVDRFTYHFRRPHRGEIIVFSSVDIQPTLQPYNGPPLIANTHYIKRLVAIGEDKVRIGDDRHLVLNGTRLDKTTPGFQKVLDFKGPPEDSVYSGYVNEVVGQAYGRRGLAQFFLNGNTQFTVRPKHYLAFGDNTMNSYDGRSWGDFPRTQVVGKALFTFWPFSGRFGPIEWW
ncbi:MAG: signal peptidase I [Verrucomicrobiales bacterium]|nr:signal peptidase I [Verrucomicrobiales bacterium]